MKKLLQRVLVGVMLGAWALVAVGSADSPLHSHKCNDEWKVAFARNGTEPGASSQDRDRAIANETMHFAGFMGLLFE